MTLKEKKFLAVVHAPSEKTLRLARALAAGARNAGAENVALSLRSPLITLPEDVIGADVIVVFTTENFGTISGAMKDFFDRIYYPCLDNTEGLPCATIVRAGLDGTGTLRALDAIVGGLKWKAIQEPLLLHGDYRQEFERQCYEVGETLSAGLEMGIF